MKISPSNSVNSSFVIQESTPLQDRINNGRRNYKDLNQKRFKSNEEQKISSQSQNDCKGNSFLQEK